MSKKNVVIFDKDDKSRQVVEIMCRKMGLTDLLPVASSKEFEDQTKKYATDNSAIAGLTGKKPEKKLAVAIIIVDWESPSNGVADFIKGIKTKYTDFPQFIVISDSKFSSKFGDLVKTGVKHLLVKPFKTSALKEKVDTALEDNKPAGPKVTAFNMGQTKKDAKEQGVGANPFSMGGGEMPKPKPKKEKKKEVEESKSVLSSRMPAPGGSGGGPSFHGKKKIFRSETPVATLVDGKIDGHYHEKVDIIGGGENCFWAKEGENEKVRLEYLSAKGTPSGIEAKIISKDDFMHMYFLCEEHGCQLLKRLGKWPPEEKK